MGAREIRLKGQGFRGALAAIERLRGPEARVATIEGMSAEPREALTFGGIVPGGWYPVAWYRELHASAQRVARTGPELSRKIGREATRHDLAGVYSWILRFVSPETLLGQAPRILGLYCEGGRVEVVEKRSGAALLRFSQMVGNNHDLWEDMVGSNEQFVTSAQGKEVRSRVLSGGQDGDDAMELEVRWTT